MCPAPVRGNAEFPKPTATDAINVAIATFEAGQRVDMAQIAERLGVGRSTLYRWVGDREALMDRVIDQTTLKLAQSVQRRVRGEMRLPLQYLTQHGNLDRRWKNLQRQILCTLKSEARVNRGYPFSADHK